jgi:hypothetical protein
MVLVVAAALSASAAFAETKYDPGATDTEIKVGNIMPYSGPASSYGVIGKTEKAFFDMINAQEALTAARSTSSPMTMPTRRRRRSSRRASWSKAMQCFSSSSRWVRRPIRRS